MSKRLKKIALYYVLAFAFGFGVATFAVPVGEQMERLDGLGLVIKIFE